MSNHCRPITLVKTLRNAAAVLCLTVVASAQTAFNTTFNTPAAGEAVAEIEATSPGASWEKPGAEAATLSVSLDGTYNQDVMLFRGAQASTYSVFLGPLSAGKHQLTITRNDRCSAEGARFSIQGVHVHSLAANDPESVALAHAPILYARADTLGRFSDVPLIMWYERLPAASGETLQYSVIFTNEDGGTPSDALMARWGHASDIEYVYRVTLDSSGGVRDEIYQAPDHKDLHFAGKKIGEHPLLLIATLNNVFTDTGYTAVQYRLLPQRADLSAATRESLMDRNPWSYRVMSQELTREGKVRPFGKEDGQKIGDPRSYLWLDAKLEVHGSAGIAAWVKRREDGRWYSSHRGRLDFAISRNGWVRTTVELPTNTHGGDIESIAIECVDLRDPRAASSVPPGECGVQAAQAFFLAADYIPGKSVVQPSTAIQLHVGEMTTVPLAH